MKLWRVLFVLSFLEFAASTAWAQGAFSFQRIARTTTTNIPSGTGRFSLFTKTPTVSNGYVAFRGSGSSSQSGVYVGTGEASLSVVANTSSNIPGGIGTFSSFGVGDIGNYGQTVVFYSSGDGRPGLYFGSPSAGLSALVNYTTPVPGPSGSGNFTQFDSLSMHNNEVAFVGGNGTLGGVYIADITSSNVSLIANRGTSIPGTSGPDPKYFTNFSSLAIHNSLVSFTNKGSTSEGVYHGSSTTPLIKVADNNTPIPNGVGNLTNFGQSQSSSTEAVFEMLGSSGQGLGVYRATLDGTVSLVANTSTAIPEGTGTFGNFGNIAISDRLLMFNVTTGGSQQGVYYSLDGGPLQKFLARGDTLDGSTVFLASIGPGSIDGTSVAVSVTFSSGGSGIYLATIPEPSMLLTLMLLACGGGWWVQQKRQASAPCSSPATP